MIVFREIFVKVLQLMLRFERNLYFSMKIYKISHVFIVHQ